MITQLKTNQIFVYGSNRAGRHGKGAAKQALKFGAVYGKTGLVGNTYGLSTKDENLKILSLSEIEKEIVTFLCVARCNLHLEFLATAVGCGLAGYTPAEIAPLFKKMKMTSNVILPKEFL